LIERLISESNFEELLEKFDIIVKKKESFDRLYILCEICYEMIRFHKHSISFAKIL